jgi:amino acid transporter
MKDMGGTTGNIESPSDRGAVEGVSSAKGLKAGALGLAASVAVALSATAPAYSLAATLGYVVKLVHEQAAAVMLLAFIPTLCIAVACQQLNAAKPDCGTTFTWSAMAFGPWIGWLGGWGMIVADVVVVANLAQIAAYYGFLLIDADGLARSDRWLPVAGTAWIATMATLSYFRIELSARTQRWLLSVELATLLLFAVVALARVYAGHALAESMRPTFSWFNPTAVSSRSALADGVLIAVFIYWGWDGVLALNEEIRGSHKAPGRAGLLSTVLLLITYILVTVAAVAFAGTGKQGIGLTNPDSADNVLAGLGEAVFGEGILSKLLILSTLTSAVACLQTTILPTARALLSMSSFGALPRAFARVHPRYLSPSFATVAMAAVSIGYYVALTITSSNVLADSIQAIGLSIAFYYSLTAFACVWYFRRRLFDSPRHLMLKGVIPMLGGMMLLVTFLKSALDMSRPDYGKTVYHGIGGAFFLGVGPLLVGVILMVLYSLCAPQFFRDGLQHHEALGRTL